MTSLKILVISSPTALERRERISKMLAESNYQWDFIYADEKEILDLNYSSKASKRAAGRELLRGELGCYASHYKCWKSLLTDQSTDYVMVMEDDVFLDLSFNLKYLVELINKCGIEYIRLYSRVMPSRKLIASLGHRKIYRFKDVAYGTQCYLISKKGAAKLIDQTGNGTTRPVDDEMDRFWANKLINLALFPYPALELNYPSTIRAQKSLDSVKGLDKLVYIARLKIDSYKRKVFNLYRVIGDARLKKVMSSYLSQRNNTQDSN